MPGLETARVIDLHAHIVLAETMGRAGTYGPEESPPGVDPWFRVGDYVLNGVRYRGGAFMEIDQRLAGLDAAAIDFQVVSPNPLTYFHFVDPATAIAFCRVHNDALVSAIGDYPERLAGFAALPIQDVAAACDELSRAVEDLGLLGAYIGTDGPRPLDHPDLDVLYERLIALDVPLFIHPGPAGIDGPAGDVNLSRFDLDIVAGFAAQETLAVATLIFGGVLDRHPRLRLCISHGGGAAAFLAGRLSAATRKRGWASAELKQDGAFEERLGRMWFDSHVHDSASLDLLIARVGDDRIVFGTNFAGWDQHSDSDMGRFAARFADNARNLLGVGLSPR